MRLFAIMTVIASLGVAESSAWRAKGYQWYRRFHANNSFVGQPLPCTSDEKICFRYNLVFHPETDRCEPLGRNAFIHCDLRADNQEFLSGSGHIFGSCPKYQDPCPGYRMAYDDLCYEKEIVLKIICDCDAEPVSHFLRGEECNCNSSTPVQVEQPVEDGRCLLPDFSSPANERSFFLEDPLGVDDTLNQNLSCSPEQSKCFLEQKVWLPEGQGCSSLLERGPCPENHLVVLDSKAAREGQVIAKCVHERAGCPSGQIRMAFDEYCHDERHIKISVPGFVARNHFGHFQVIREDIRKHFYPKGDETMPNICVVESITLYVLTGLRPLTQPHCETKREPECKLYEVQNQPPTPEPDR